MMSINYNTSIRLLERIMMLRLNLIWSLITKYVE